MTKQEKIQEAYGEHWKTVKDYVDDNGFLPYNFNHISFNVLCCFENEIIERHKDLWRPKSLQGIENNNGWIELKHIPNEIEIEVSVWLYDSESGDIVCSPANEFVPLKSYTHYQPINKPLKPLY